MRIARRLRQPGFTIAGLVLVAPMWLNAADPATPGAANDTGQHFRALLSSDAPDLRTLERHYRALLDLCPDDSRVEYGYGLVLMSRHRYSDGVAHLQMAAAGDVAYLPAQRAVIREAIRQGEHQTALEQIVQLADQLNRPEFENDPATAESARWIGLAVAYLADPVSRPSLADDVARADAAITQALPAPLRQQYQQGQQQTRDILATLQDEEQEAEQQAEARQQEKQDATRARIDEFQSRQEKLEEAKQEQQLRAVDTSTSLEDQLEQVADRFQTLNKSATSLLQSIQATQLAIQQLKSQADAQPQRRRQDRRLEAEMLARSRELDLYLREYASTLQSRATTARQGRLLVARWKATSAQARRADNSAEMLVARFEKLNQSLTRSLEEAKQATPQSRRLRSIASRRRSFATYDPFDLEQELQRLAQEVGVPDK